MLTTKQKNFCAYVVEGNSYTDAYLKAYDGNSKQAANIEGSKLALRSDIQEYIKELEKPINDALQLNQLSIKEKQINFINDRINYCIKTDNENGIIKYTEMLNKIYSLYKDENELQMQDASEMQAIPTASLLKLVE